MRPRYFKTVKADIMNTPKWRSKMLLLGLVGLIPIFGQIVIYGYFYGWARDIAWRVQTPMPERIFNDADAKLYSRGFFALVISFVFGLAPAMLSGFGSILEATPLFLAGLNHHAAVGAVAIAFIISSLVSVASIALSFFAVLFAWVGSMRMSIYGRLSAGFQLGKIWAMMRRDFAGLMRILGMYLLLWLIAGVVIVAFVSLVVVVVAAIGALAGTSYATALGAYSAGSDAGAFAWAVIALLVILGIVLFLLVVYAAMVCLAFITAATTRALGYWTQQFEVAAWRGQDDPMPFEMGQA